VAFLGNLPPLWNHSGSIELRRAHLNDSPHDYWMRHDLSFEKKKPDER
jgi:hypothetical protein